MYVVCRERNRMPYAFQHWNADTYMADNKIISFSIIFSFFIHLFIHRCCCHSFRLLNDVVLFLCYFCGHYVVWIERFSSFKKISPFFAFMQSIRHSTLLCLSSLLRFWDVSMTSTIIFIIIIHFIKRLTWGNESKLFHNICFNFFSLVLESQMYVHHLNVSRCIIGMSIAKRKQQQQK